MFVFLPPVPSPFVKSPPLEKNVIIVLIKQSTSNIIYCIHCSNCSNWNKLHIGETSRGLGDRIRDHLYDIRKNDLSKLSLAILILLIILFQILLHSVFSVINGGNDCRKTKEMRLIHPLGIFNPLLDKWTFHILLTFCWPGTFLSFLTVAILS